LNDAAVKRFHFFELFTAANFLVVALFAWPTVAIAGSPFRHMLSFAVTLTLQAAAGVAIRAVIALLRRDRSYLRAIATREWLLDTVRLIAFGSATIITYGWIKLVVPLYHPRLFDEELWVLDQFLAFGIAPSQFLLELLSASAFLRVIDFGYAYIFFTSAILAYTYFLSEPDRRIRIGFANGNSVLWISGAWLYLLLPSVGPAYRFPDIWMVHAEALRHTQTLQALLMRNYQNVLRAAEGMPVSRPVNIALGIGAFPSLHVAFQTYVFFWMRRLWRSGEVLFGIFAFTMFIGSMITGWHYLVDAIAGFAMAYLCYRFCFPRYAAGDPGTDDTR
jgi:hypothetical protein